MASQAMKLPTVTVGEILDWDPCCGWSKRIPEIAGKRRKHWNALHIIERCQSNRVPYEDILWLVLREELIPESHLRELACRFAESALRAEQKAGREPDERSWESVRVARRYARGRATRQELAAAKAAARAAARDAAWAAAWDAARAAARAAAWAAACKRQVGVVKTYLKRLAKS